MDAPSSARRLVVTLQTIQVTERAQWDTVLASLPSAHVLQTWDWGDFKSRWGWQPLRLLVAKDGCAVAAAQILRRRLPRTPLCVAYVPKGPALNYADTSVLVQALSILEEQARQEHTILLKIDPDVWLGPGAENVPRRPGTAAVLETLAKRHWRSSPEQIQFKNTVVIDLATDEDELLARMKAKTRYNIRLTARRGVYVRRGTEGDLDTFYTLYSETSERNEFLIRPAGYYVDVWTQFIRAERAHLLLAEVEGEPIAGLILFHFGQKAWYMYGASSSRHRQLMPNYLLQWEAMQLAKRLGCIQYDLWGAPDHFDESDPMWGVYRFKTGFGGETMRGVGAYDFSPTPWLYSLYSAAMPKVLTIMRRRRRLLG
jgi:peptidoglycan pentaglycine glycine transferase (the first glycine)